ncbi:MAG: DUF2442 domain-containing protein [Planctomycetes bacterium]|nr:DUF2442 domain-containing protein [Planctomycetota bacterium]
MIRVKGVTCLAGYAVRLTFTDGTRRDIDLEPYLRGPIFEPLRDPARFREVAVDPELGTIVWPNGADICPDVLYHGRTPASFEKPARK